MLLSALASPDLRDVEASHTAVMLHWPAAHQHDLTIVWPAMIRGEELHRRIDALIEEHVATTRGQADVVTEVTIWWHHPDGVWESEEFVSHYYGDSE
jgi:hypothetical protein